MALSTPAGIYGIHDVRLFSRSTGEHIAHFQILGTVTANFEAEFAELKGGSQKFNFATAVNNFSSSVSIECRELTSDIVYSSIGGSRTETAADSAGETLDFANKTGTSVYDAAEGIATVTIDATNKDDAKAGWYLIKAVGTATVDVYAMSSANFGRGTNETYISDEGKVTSAVVTVPAAGSTVAVTNFGLILTGGSSSAIALTASDTAIFWVSPPHGGYYENRIGESPMEFPEVEMIISSEDEAGLTTALRLYRVKTAGLGLPFTEKDYGSWTINASVLYDTDENAVGSLRRTLPE